ncbi:Receptor-interacting serine/threonine-protein kinase 3 [Tulasnella sp. 408]|nr:Receptor-interacting serine/threonine-protein kinase 3 [Tulasnella sp. 408]
MPNGDVLEYIERFKPDIQQRIAFVGLKLLINEGVSNLFYMQTKGITAGLACLHNFDPAICHADLKPANVLIDLQMNAVLCDFGLASFVGGSPTAPGLVTTTALKGGTPRYMSPELHFDDDSTHSLESDVLTGTIPYAKYLGERQLCMAIVREQPPGDIALLLPNNFERGDSESALALQFLHSIIPKCWDFEPHRRPRTRTLLSQISNPSCARVPQVGGGEGIEPSASMEGTSLPLASRNPSGVRMDSGEGAQGATGGVAAHNGPGSENLHKRKRAGSSSSARNNDVNDNARRVRTRLEGSSDGRMWSEEDEEREEANALRAQLLALADALDGGTQVGEGQISRVREIKQALGNKWGSQLATVAQKYQSRQEDRKV